MYNNLHSRECKRTMMLVHICLSLYTPVTAIIHLFHHNHENSCTLTLYLCTVHGIYTRAHAQVHTNSCEFEVDANSREFVNAF